MRNIVLILACSGLVFGGCSKQPSPPKDKPVGGQFGQTGEIGKLSEAVYKFYSCEHHFPADWQEMVDKKYLPKVPVAPAGKKYVWDDSGKVNLESAAAAKPEEK